VSPIMQSSFDLQFGTFERFEQANRRFIPALTGEGWRLIGAFRNATGDISVASHLWELPDSDSLESAPARVMAADPGLLEDVVSLAEIIQTERISFLEPLSQSPGRGHDVHETEPGVVFQKISFDLEFGALERFEEAMRTVIPALSGQGWRLVGSYRFATGDVHSAVNLWQLPDLESMRTAGPRARAADPGLAAVVAELIKVIRTETVELLSPLAHHPSPT
jgi:hypothetical protein